MEFRPSPRLPRLKLGWLTSPGPPGRVQEMVAVGGRPMKCDLARHNNIYISGMFGRVLLCFHRQRYNKYIHRVNHLRHRLIIPNISLDLPLQRIRKTLSRLFFFLQSIGAYADGQVHQKRLLSSEGSTPLVPSPPAAPIWSSEISVRT